MLNTLKLLCGLRHNTPCGLGLEMKFTKSGHHLQDKFTKKPSDLQVVIYKVERHSHPFTKEPFTDIYTFLKTHLQMSTLWSSKRQLVFDLRCI